MAHRIAQWAFIIATLLVAPSAFAQDAAAAKIRAACGRDFLQLCRGVQPGGGRVVECLLAHRSALSPSCSAELAALPPGGGLAAKPPPAAQGPGPLPPAVPPPGNAAPPPPGNRAAFQASCGPDVRQVCAGVPREKQAIAKCLVSHNMELSSTCKMFLKEARAERAAPKNMPSYSPPPPPPPGPSGMPPPPSSSTGAPAPAVAPSNE